MLKAVVTLSVICVLLCVSELIQFSSSYQIYYVDGVSGNDSLCSLPESTVSCRSLEYVARKGSWSTAKIIIQSPHLSLKEVIRFKRFAKILMTGSHTNTTIECVPKEGRTGAGLIFSAIKQVTMENITIYRCGASRWYSSKLVRSAVHVIAIRTLVLSKTRVMQSNGTGIVILTDMHGSSVVNISNSQFVRNNVPENNVSQHLSGGGVYVRMRNTNHSRLIFHECLFQSNRATAKNSFTFLTSFGIPIRGSGEGGGLKIYMSGTVSFNNISISKCNFSDNLAFSGGGLSVQMFGSAIGNLVDIQESRFTRNGCPPGMSGQTLHETTPIRTGSGGGILLGYQLRKGHRNNHYSIQHVEFTENCAEHGGGVSFFSTHSIFSGITFVDCTWTGNSAHIGAAVDTSPQIHSRLSAGFIPAPVFTNCHFIANKVAFRREQYQLAPGAGTLFSSSLNVQFKSSVYFELNSGSAFVIVNGIANFSTCNATFVNNTGVQGGAIALIGKSLMLIGQGYHYTFINNRADDRGGAIYSYLIDIHDFTSSKSCFIQYFEEPGMNTPLPEWNATFTFRGNRAEGPGKSIFVSSLQSCMPGFLMPQDRDSDMMPGVFSFDNIGKYQVATDGTHFNVTGTLPFEVIPGEEHRLELSIMDDLNQTVNTTFRASVANSTILVGATFSCVTGNVIKLLGRDGDSGRLLLQTMTSQASSVIIEVVLIPCPPGFRLAEQNKCVCDAQSYNGLTGCSDSTSEMFSYVKRGLWVGYIRNDNSNKEELATGTCPFKFCSYNGSSVSTAVRLPRSQSTLDESICGPKRTGIFCGNCAKGYTVYYHSPHYSCSDERLCNLGWIFFILSEIAPVTLLFVLVLIFNISFTSGAVNGFILFSQLLDTLQINATDYCGENYFIWGYRIIYGFFNMEFFNTEPLSFCIWKHATVLHVLTFKYITIAYALILVFGVVLFMKYCGHRCLGKYIRITTIKSSVIHGLAAFLVICYGQCIKVSLSLLLPGIPHGRNHRFDAYRVFLNGEIKYFSKEHFPYAAPAIFFLLTIGALPPTLLLAYPLTNRMLALCGISDSSLVTSVSRKISISKLKPFLDSFQGCFKNNFRFFSGLYFIYRWVGLLVYAFCPHLTGFYPLVGNILVLILTVHAVAQPYETRWHNIIDAFLLANLLTVNGITGFNYYYSGKSDRRRCDKFIRGTSITQTVLIYLPVVYMVTYLVVLGCKKYHGWKKEVKKSTMQVCTPLEDFPARRLGDDVEYNEFNVTSSFRSPSPNPVS